MHGSVNPMLFESHGESPQLNLVPGPVGQEQRNLDVVLDASLVTADSTMRDIDAEYRQLDDPTYAFGDAMIDEDGLHDFFTALPITMDANLEPQALDDALVGHFVGPTGEQDPGLLRRYRFGENNEFWFKKLATRMTSEGTDPTLWMIAYPELGTGSDGGTAAGSGSPARQTLEELVAPDVGARLIKL